MTNTVNVIPTIRIAGAVLGLALGDATGDPVEFRSYESIMADGGVRLPPRFRVTDDTQMSLSVWRAIENWTLSAGQTLGQLRLELAAEFLAYRVDPDTPGRAPGSTVMGSLGRLARLGLGHWTQATDPASAGCGSVMRAAWIGVHPKLSDRQVEQVAMAQAVLTHGPAENPFCAAALASLTRALARGEVVPGQAAAWLKSWVLTHAGAYDRQALGEVHQVIRDWHARVGAPAGQPPEEYVSQGLMHVFWVAAAARALTARLRDEGFWSFDVAEVTGEGWRAREAVAMAVGILDALPVPRTAGDAHDTFVDALKRAAQTSGDSDSTAAITGALVGAWLGDAFPAFWLDRFESRYRRELVELLDAVGV